MENITQLNIIEAYEMLRFLIEFEFLNEEKCIIRHPELGTVKSGGKKYYADECRRMLAELSTKYYSTESLDKILEYKGVLKSRLLNDYSYATGKTDEKVSKKWAVQSVLSDIEIIEGRFKLNGGN